MRATKSNEPALHFIRILYEQGIFTVDAAHPEIGIIGGLTAILLAWRKVQVVLCVLAAIGVNIVLYMIIG